MNSESTFDRFKFLEMFVSPTRGKRKRSKSGSRSKENSNERNKPVKIQKNKVTVNVLKTTAKLELKPPKTETTPGTLKKTLSRTNLEQKYDSPDKSFVQNISCDENSFVYRPIKKEVPGSKYVNEQFYQGVKRLNVTGNLEVMDIDLSPPRSLKEKKAPLPQTIKLNYRLKETINTFKSPKRKVPKENGFLDKFQALIKKRTSESLQALAITNTNLKEDEQKIKVTSIALISTTHYLVKFNFVNESNEITDDGKEHLASLSLQIYGQLLNTANQFIVKIAHSIDIKNNAVMHDILHLRVF